MNIAWAAAKTNGQVTSDLASIIIGGLLNWPFLAVCLIGAFLYISRKEIRHLLKKRSITVNFAGNTVTVGDAMESLNDETAKDLLDLQGQLQRLEASVKELANAAGDPKTAANIAETLSSPAGMGAGTEAEPKDRREAIWTRLRRELLQGRFVWRSLDRLALVAGDTPEMIHDVLAAHPDEVKIGRSKSNRTIARHVTREPQS